MRSGPVLTAFLDASALYGAELRNLLMRLAMADAFVARWASRQHHTHGAPLRLAMARISLMTMYR